MDETIDITGKDMAGQASKEQAERYKEAVWDLVENFSAIPERWMRVIAKDEGEDFYGVMWGTMFLVNDSVDRERILELLRDVEDEDLGSVREIAGTGIYAWEIGGELVLGIQGAGYDFFQYHWSKLYDALGYRWHEVK